MKEENKETKTKKETAKKTTNKEKKLVKIKKEENAPKIINKKLNEETSIKEVTTSSVENNEEESKDTFTKLKETVSNFFKKFKLQKLKFNTIELVLACLMTLVFGFLIGELVFKGTTSGSNNYSNEINKVYDALIEEYDGEIDPIGLSESAIEGMMQYLQDEYSVYYDTEEASDFYERLNGTFIGLGVEMTKGEDGIPVVVSVLKDTAAAESGLQTDDKFLKVNGEDVTQSSLDDLSEKIKGTTPKTFVFTMLRDGEEIEKIITTKEVSIQSVASTIFEKNNKKIGYISISIFASNTDEQFEEALKEIEKEGIDRLVIDVRSNLGGHLDTVTNILNLFLNKSQVLYQLKDGDSIRKVYGKTNDTRTYPVAVLINQASASASEVLASALNEAYNAETIGMQSYGKGTAQTAMMLSTGSMIKYTSEEWLTSNGNSINKVGITPTVEVELNEDYFTDYSDEKDNQLQKALEVIANK